MNLNVQVPVPENWIFLSELYRVSHCIPSEGWRTSKDACDKIQSLLQVSEVA